MANTPSGGNSGATKKVPAQAPERTTGQPAKVAVPGKTSIDGPAGNK